MIDYGGKPLVELHPPGQVPWATPSASGGSGSSTTPGPFARVSI